MKSEQIKINVLLPVYKRPEIFRICAENLNFPDWIDAEVYCVLSHSDRYLKKNIKTCIDFDYSVLFEENEPMGRKMNAAFKYMREYDYLMNIGSDDIIHPDYWEQVKPHLFNKVNMIGMNQILAFDCYSGDCLKLKIDMAWGGGRLIKSELIINTIDLLGYIYTPSLQSGLDTDSESNIRRCNTLKPVVIDGCYLIDLKTTTNINTFLGLKNIEHETSKDYNRFGSVPGQCLELANSGRLH